MKHPFNGSKSGYPLVSNRLLKNPPKQVKCPIYDRDKLQPGVLHMGVGNFHRAHQALYIDDLIALYGTRDWAICGVGIMPQDASMKRLIQQDYLYTLVEKNDTQSEARIIGSLKNYIYGYDDPESVFEALANPSIKLVTLTATEAGYYFHQGTGALILDHPAIQNDIHNPYRPKTIFGYLAEGLERRRNTGIAPFTVLSCDNIQANGHITRSTLLAFCHERNQALAKWIEENVCFPNSMVDRITPATAVTVYETIRSTYHIEDAFPVIAEPFKQWIIEDQFCNTRPPFEKVGVQFTSNVAPYEKMKIRLLNAAHSAMGYLGYLCGYTYVYEIPQVPEFVTYLKNLMDLEVSPLIGDVPGIDLTQYKNTLIERFANKTIKDHLLRICMNGSAKIPAFILPSIVEQLERGGPIGRLTLCVASWVRFLNGKDEHGTKIPIEDPQAEILISMVQKSHTDPVAILQLTDIFSALGQSERFVNELKKALTSLNDKGPRDTLKAYL